MLNEQEKPCTCNCRGKTSCKLNGSCQHKNLVYYCKVSIPDIKQNHLHYTSLTEHVFKDSINIIILSNTSQRETEQNFLISYGVKRKRRLICIADKAKKLFSSFKKMQVMSYREISHHFSTKNLLNKRNELVIKLLV